MPRLFLIHGVNETTPRMKGVKVQWPFEMGLEESEVIDLSLSGLAVQGAGLLTKLKLGQSFEVKVKIEGLRDSVALKVRVVRIQAQRVGLAMESISTEGRLTLDQAVKDRLVAENLNEFSPTELAPEWKGSQWFHGPFDTNFFIWKKEDGSLKSALVEYDHLIWLYQEGKISLHRSGSATDEARGYLEANLLTEGAEAKVSMGASWLDRLLKMMEKAPSFAELQILGQLLRSQRNQ